MNTGNRIEGATSCPSWCRPLCPLFQFLCSILFIHRVVLRCDLPSQQSAKIYRKLNGDTNCWITSVDSEEDTGWAAWVVARWPGVTQECARVDGLTNKVSEKYGSSERRKAQAAMVISHHSPHKIPLDRSLRPTSFRGNHAKMKRK